MLYEPSNLSDRQSPCANCSAPFGAHVQADAGDLTRGWRCPDPRSRSIEEAAAALRRAGAGAFVERGNLQRLMDHRPGTCTPMCPACDALLATSR